MIYRDCACNPCLTIPFLRCKLYKYENCPAKEVWCVAGGKHILGKAKRHIFGTAKVG